MFYKLITLACILLTSFIFAQGSKKSTENKMELIVPNSSIPDTGWGNTDEILKNLEILDRLDEGSSKKRFKDALADFKIAVEIYESTEASIEAKREDYQAEVHPEDRYDWQKHAREEQRNKDLQKMNQEGRTQAIQYLIKSMNTLEKIESPNVKESMPYLELKAGLYREYSKHQFAFKNYGPVVDILTRYLTFNEKHSKESEPHRMLAHCYEKMELTATRNKKYSIAEDYKENKKKHILQFAEIQYGKNSKEYEGIFEKVMRDY
jgi:hypothetical protein